MKATGKTRILVSGRWDPMIAVVDLEAALNPANRGTDRAVISRPRVTPDIVDADGTMVPAIGLPVSIVVSQDRRQIFVVNHAGSASPEATAHMPHGHPGAIAVLDLAAALDPANDGTLGAVRNIIPTGTGGPVGGTLTPDGRYLLVTSAEGNGTEDGGHHVSVLDAATGRHVHNYPLDRQGSPSPNPSPDEGFGRFPNPNGIAVSPLSGGLVFTANGGTDDISVLRLPALLAGEPNARLASIPMPHGPFGLAVSPDGSLLAVANRESACTSAEGSTVSIIDIQSVLDRSIPEISHVRVGSDDRPSRPMTVAFTPDGTAVFVTCFNTGTLSRIQREKGRWVEGLRVMLPTLDELDPCPRGVAVSGDGRFVLVAGGRRAASNSSVLWILDSASLEEIGLVSGVGNESYLIESIAL